MSNIINYIKGNLMGRAEQTKWHDPSRVSGKIQPSLYADVPINWETGEVGSLQKGLLKQAALRLRQVPNTRFGGTSAKNIMKSIREIPNVVAKTIKNIEILDSSLPLRGQFSHIDRTLRVSPGILNKKFGKNLIIGTTRDTVAHESTHALQSRLAIARNTQLEKQTNYRIGIIRNVLREQWAKLSPENKKKLYLNLPQEIHARAVATSYNKAIRAGAKPSDELFLNIFNKELNPIIKGLKKTAPKLYKRSVKDTNRMMQIKYGKHWHRGLPEFKSSK